MKNPLTRHRRTSILLAGSAIVLGLGLSGCSALPGILSGTEDAARDDDGQVTENTDIDIFALEVGDCMPASGDAGEISEASVVPCADPHAEEVFFQFSLPDGDFPDDTAIDAEVEAQCIPAFVEFAGIAWEDSTLGLYPITPTAATWSGLNDRVVQCVIFDPSDEQPVGSLAGAAR